MASMTSMIDLDSIYNFLDKNEYLIRVTRTETGCVLEVPAFCNNLNNNQANIIEFSVVLEKNKVGVNKTNRHYNQTQFVNIPKYAIRTYIICCIFEYCLRMGYDVDIIAFYDTDGSIMSFCGDNSLEKLLKQPRLAADKKLEESLFEIFSEVVDNGFSEGTEELAKSEGVVEGYRLIYSILGNFE